MEKRLIDGLALLKLFSVSPSGDRYRLRDCDNFPVDIHLEEVQKQIKNAPTIDAVEVVRCKDCKFYHKQKCAMDDWHFSETKENDFCSFGQKKEEARDNG